MITENLSTLKIHKLTQEQYERELAAGRLDENAIYLTPEEVVDMSKYATVEQLNSKADSVHKHNISDITNFPSSLPANGGNADTVDGKHASEFAMTSDITNVRELISTNTENIDALEELVGNTSVSEQISTAIRENVSSWNNLTDKPFYMESSEVVLLDGEFTTEYIDAYSVFGIDTAYNEELEAAPEKVTMIYDGVEYKDITFTDIPDLGKVGGNLYHMNALFGTSFEDTGEPFILAVTKTGCAIMTLDTEATAHAIRLFIAGEPVDKINPSCLPEGYPYTELGDKVLIDGEFTTQYLEQYGFFGINVPFEEALETVPEKATLVYDGVEYSVTFTDIPGLGKVGGNLFFVNSLFGTSFENTGEPFILGADQYGCIVVTLDTTPTAHTFKVSAEGIVIHKLSREYIDETLIEEIAEEIATPMVEEARTELYNRTTVPSVNLTSIEGGIEHGKSYDIDFDFFDLKAEIDFLYQIHGDSSFYTARASRVTNNSVTYAQYVWIHHQHGYSSTGNCDFTLIMVSADYDTLHVSSVKVPFTAESRYIPEALKNPLTINGTVYDGSSAVSVSISVDNKMDKNDPVGTGSFSMNRKAGTAVGHYSHAEGRETTASGEGSHAEGYGTNASGIYSHAEGMATKSSGNYSHAEGDNATASARASHAEGCSTASGDYSHAEGNSTASGTYSHTEGRGTRTSGEASHVQGRYNIEDTENKYAHIVGNGSSHNARSNAHTLDWDGNAWYSGDVYVGSTSGTNRDEGSKKLATEEYINIRVPAWTDADEGKFLRIVNGTPTWVSIPDAKAGEY